MKLLISIGLNIALLFVFTAAPTSHAWACGGKSLKKEIKCKVDCQKDCCKNAHPKNKKRGCTGNCCCNVSTSVFAVLEQFIFELSSFTPVFEEKQPISYKKDFPKSVFIKFWQPPKL